MTSTTGGGTRILGSLGAVDGKGLVRVEDRYDTDIDDLWSALTDPDRLARWYGTVEGDLRAGGEFRTYLEGPDLRGVGRVETCEPPRRLRVVTRETDESWQRSGGVPPFDQTLEATLTVDGDRTVLVIEAHGMPLDKVAAYGAGLQIHVEHLAAHVAGRGPGDDDGTRWGELVPAYQHLAAAIRSAG
ncbi:SRPBCC domain-containing protein [Actinopolymorpha sp. NPDC004070]|uniref:SRPBCC domain-containing protein n=1 Tax=Actinopolymorpha sp. NPDC004070 TaxID=3154548 RepID=UPI0033AAD6C5